VVDLADGLAVAQVLDSTVFMSCTKASGAVSPARR
jgi:hypothetical protein